VSRRYRRSRPRALGDLLGADQRGLGRRIRAMRALLDAWRGVVGTPLCEVAVPQRLDGTTLWVGVTDDIWMQELSMLQADIVARLQTQLPSLRVRRVRFQVLPPTRTQSAVGSGGPTRRTHTPGRPTRSQVERVQNPALRAALARLAETDEK